MLNVHINFTVFLDIVGLHGITLYPFNRLHECQYDNQMVTVEAFVFVIDLKGSKCWKNKCLINNTFSNKMNKRTFESVFEIFNYKMMLTDV